MKCERIFIECLLKVFSVKGSLAAWNSQAWILFLIGSFNRKKWDSIGANNTGETMAAYNDS